MTDIDDVQATTQQWLAWDENPETKLEIENLVKSEEWNQLRRMMMKRLEFGTAGIRGRMGAGFSQMNDLVLIQVTQGLRYSGCLVFRVFSVLGV